MNSTERMWNAINKTKEMYLGRRKGYSMTFSEMAALGEYTTNYLYDGISAVFNYGFIKGIRYQKAQEKKKRKVQLKK